jgi:AcrR family transcriptional regulator
MPVPAKAPRKKRRTKQVIELAVMDAVHSLIEEVGFNNVTLTGIAARAQIEPTVFYRRFSNLDELFDVYSHKYDYWLAGIAELMPPDLSDEESMKWILLNLTRALLKNRGMQQMLIWELSDDNPVTRRTATLREKINESLIHELEKRFENTGVDLSVMAALLISGIYYLILHRNMSTFCNVDFSSKSGRERLEKTIDQLVSILFATMRSQHAIQPQQES